MKENFKKTCKYLRISTKDTPKTLIINYFPKIFNFMDEFINNEKGCLVHCFCGVSRSSTIVIAYLMYT